MSYVVYGVIGAVTLGAVTALTPQAQAQEAAQVAPDYLIQSIFDASTAEQLSAFCPHVSMNFAHASETSEVIFARLEADGLGVEADFAKLRGLEEGVSALQVQFVSTYQLDAPTEDRVCAAALTEIDRASTLGAYLQRVSE